MLEYKRTKQDENVEKYDLDNNPLMRWLKNPDAFKFTPGDILIRKSFHGRYNPHANQWDGTWETDIVNSTSKVPKRFMYVFENELGIGYLKQLTIDGKGFTQHMVCVANLDYRYVRFELDQDYSDSIILGGDASEAIQNKYEDIRAFRKKAMDNNRKILIKRSQFKDWLAAKKIGDAFYFGWTFDDFADSKWTVTKIESRTAVSTYNQDPNYVVGEPIITVTASNDSNHPAWGQSYTFSFRELLRGKTSDVMPYPMKDKLCGQQK